MSLINAIYLNVFKDDIKLVRKSLEMDKPELIVIEFSEDWKDYTKTIILGINDTLLAINSEQWVNNTVQIPTSVSVQTGILQAKVIGFKENNEYRQSNFTDVIQYD